MPHTAEHDSDLAGVITNDHRQVEEVFTELEARTGPMEDRKDLVDHAIAELVRHFSAEEQYVFPEALRRLGDGEEVVRRELIDHNQAEGLMKDLEVFGPEHPHFEQKLREFIGTIRDHVLHEESSFLPKLESACSKTELEALGQKMLWAKTIAPTRPHPHAPNMPPANQVLGPGVGFIDKIRDALGGRNA